jgi:addiction module RelE/StbE family toxin
MASVEWTESAISDVAEIRAYIEQFNPDAAVDVAESLIEAGDRLALLPGHGRPIGSFRRELTTVRPYVIRYSVQDGRVSILRVRHGARVPDSTPPHRTP